MINKRLLTSHLFFSMVLAPQLSSGPAWAEIYEVTNTSNSGAGSLRQAISDANNNNHTGVDTITFGAATDGKTILLAGAKGEDNNAGGDLDILDGGDLTIQGNGAANTNISGGWVDRVFHICPGGGCSNTVTFNGVTIRNGGMLGGHGGGIYNYGTVNLSTGSVVKSNMATHGGGIYNRGTLNVSNSTIGVAGESNSAVDSGGGIYNVNGTVTLNGSTVNANIAHDGGGIFNSGTLKVQNSSIIGGASAGNKAGIGGGIRNESTGTTTIDGSTISANTADMGGGIFNSGTLKVQNGSTIGGTGAGNKAVVGGGIYDEITSRTTIDNSTVSANTASDGYAGDGGGIFSDGTLNVVNGSTIGGKGAGNSASVTGGGIITGPNSTTTVDNSTISANTTLHGGGIMNSGKLNVLNGSTVSANAAGDGGGGIYNSYKGNTSLDGSILSSNTALYGGGIYNKGTLNISNSSIGGAGVGNQATIWGGGIYNSAGYTTVTSSCILNNRAIINGGGLYNDEDTAVAIKVTGSNIVGNSNTSFFNNQTPLQTATGNWWGAATGPKSPGADTVDGNVDTSDFLTRPIPCLELDSFPWPLFLPAMIGKERP